jgi:hypothetical protein
MKNTWVIRLNAARMVVQGESDHPFFAYGRILQQTKGS